MQTAVGPVDLTLISEEGRITLLECKLWRNPEARRLVVAQILDYGKELASWDYETLEAAVRRASSDPRSLFERVRDAGVTTDEPSFIDAVEANLNAGRFNLLLVGDGIRESAERLIDFFRHDTALGYRFGLIELAVYKMPPEHGQGFLLQPRVLAKTVELERVIAGSPVRTKVSVVRTMDLRGC